MLTKEEFCTDEYISVDFLRIKINNPRVEHGRCPSRGGNGLCGVEIEAV